VNGDPRESGTDVFATLVWGLRRYALLVLAMVLALGVVVPVALAHRAPQFEATAQLGPADKLLLPNTDPLPRIAETVFNNGAVEQAIRKLLDQPKGNIIPAKVQLIAAQDNLVLEVVAHAKTATQAMEIADQAANTFLLELNKYSKSVAFFTFTHHATQAKKVPKLGGGYASVALGLFAGLLAGIGLVGLIMVIRRPVVDVSAAQVVTGAPLIGRISLPRHGPPGAAGDRGIGLLSRRLLTTSASTIHVAAPSHGQAQKLADLMVETYGRMPALRRPQQKRTAGQAHQSPLPKVLAPEGADEWICTPHHETYTVLLVPEGISTRKLRLFAEGHDTGAPTGVVMVTTHRGHRKASTQGRPRFTAKGRRLKPFARG
jgi:hypothetical protein